MLNNNYIQELVQLKDIIVNDVKQDDFSINIYLHLPKKSHHCPDCQQTTSLVHDYRQQTIKDCSAFGKITYLHYKKRRYRCPHCNKRFPEKNTFLPKYHRMTTRLIKFIVKKMKSTHSMTSIAKECNLSVTTIFRIFKYINYVNLRMPEVLSIDEFKGNAGRKFQGIITDPKSRKVLDILEGREQHILTSYFRKFKDRNNVKYFVMDMYRPYKEIAETYFKNAKIVIDKYHFIRQITWAFDRVRKQEQQKFYTTRRKYFKRSRFLLLMRRSKLQGDQLDQVSAMLSISPRLATAYWLKEKYYEFVDCSNKKDALKKLEEWYICVSSQNEKEFDVCMKTMINWQEYILNSFDCPYTNGYTEGVNNKIKVLKRNAYGVRNFNRFRNRILHMMAF